MGRLGKRQLLYLTKRLCEVDVDVYVANVTQQVEERESVKLATYECRKELWMSWKSSGKLTVLLTFFLVYLHRALRRCVYAPKVLSAAVPIHVYARTHRLPREATQVHTRVRLGGRGL